MRRLLLAAVAASVISVTTDAAVASIPPGELRAQAARAWRQALRDCKARAGCAHVTFWHSQQGAKCSHYWFFFQVRGGSWRWVDSLQCPAGMVSHGGGPL